MDATSEVPKAAPPQFAVPKADGRWFANSTVLPVRLEGSPARYWIGRERRLLLSNADEAVTGFLPGWRARFVYAGLAPTFLLELEHEDGRQAAWFLDEHMSRLGGSVAELPAERRADLLRRVGQLLRGVWADLLEAVSPRSPTSDDVSGFFCVNDALRIELAALHYDGAPPVGSIDFVAAIDAPHRRLVVSGAQGPVSLNAGNLRATLQRHIADENVRLCIDGEMRFPSPADGRELGTAHGLYLDDNFWAYRVADDGAGYTFLVVAFASHFRTIALYFPRDHLMLCLDDFHRLIMTSAVPDLNRRLYLHLALHGDVLRSYLCAPTRQAMHVLRGRSVMHIGHTMWNDMAGITHLIESVPERHLPQFAVFDAEDVPEMYGPLDRVFPETSGRVRRFAQSFDSCIGQIYREQLRLLKATTNYVPRSTGARILAAAETAPENAADRAAADKLRASPDLVVYVNVRVEHRTLVDPAGFCEALVDLFAARDRATTIIIDGHDRRRVDNPSWMYSTYDEGSAKRPPLGIEREIADRMRLRAGGTKVSIVSTIGSMVAQSLLWCRAADFFRRHLGCRAREMPLGLQHARRDIVQSQQSAIARRSAYLFRRGIQSGSVSGALHRSVGDHRCAGIAEVAGDESASSGEFQRRYEGAGGAYS